MNDMKRWVVHLTTGARTAVEVEAEDRESALEAAYDSENLDTTICHQCASKIDVGDDWDIPSDARIEDYVYEIE